MDKIKKSKMNDIKFSNVDNIKLYKMVLKGDVIKRFPPGFWDRDGAKESAKECTKYLIESILKYDDTKLKENVSINLFKKYKLSGMLNICFSGCVYKAVDNVYPDKFSEWELNYIPRGYWKDKENGIKVVKWLIDDKLKLDDEMLKKKLSKEMFEYNGFRSMLKCCFNDNPYEAINSTYPDKFKQDDFEMYNK